MRRSIAVAVAALAAGLGATQQVTAQTSMAGVKIGVVSASLDAGGEPRESRTEPAFGGFVRLVIGGGLSIQPEALLVRKGSKNPAGVGIELSYLQLPLLVQFHFPTLAGGSPRAFAGPSMAFEVGCELVEAGLSEPCREASLDHEDAAFSFVFGIGLDIPAGFGVITLDGRYDLGVSEIAIDEDPGADRATNATSRAWEFFAGVGFPFGP